jgi:two-component system NarL family sensor kinase
VLAARQDILSVLKRHPDESLERALEGLRDAAGQMREATFELHPAVLAGAGLDRAVMQLATASSARSGIEFTADIDYGGPHAIDAMVFGVVRELVSNVVRHSGATRARMTLVVVDGECRLDVVDDGIGLSDEQALRRLKHGHIGLASQRSRVEAAGGTMRSVAVGSGTHIAVRMPLRPLAPAKFR